LPIWLYIEAPVRSVKVYKIRGSGSIAANLSTDVPAHNLSFSRICSEVNRASYRTTPYKFLTELMTYHFEISLEYFPIRISLMRTCGKIHSTNLSCWIFANLKLHDFYRFSLHQLGISVVRKSSEIQGRRTLSASNELIDYVELQPDFPFSEISGELDF